jgi:hypothetical protein
MLEMLGQAQGAWSITYITTISIARMSLRHIPPVGVAARYRYFTHGRPNQQRSQFKALDVEVDATGVNVLG